MNINDYIEKLRAKPAHQRERVVILATAVSFLIILVIWLVSFSEMNKASQTDPNSSAVDQLNNLKGDMGESKKSIEEMWNEMPDQSEMGTQELDNAGTDNLNSAQNQLQENNEQNSDIPQLP